MASGSIGPLQDDEEGNRDEEGRASIEVQGGPPPLRGDSSRPAPWPDEPGALQRGPKIKTQGRGYGDMAEEILMRFQNVIKDFTPLQSSAKNSGNIFPLPETHEVITHYVDGLSPSQLHVLRMICTGLNSYYGTGASCRTKLPLAAATALRSLASYAIDVSQWGEKCDGSDWENFLAVKSVDYQGEEVKVAKPFSWDNIQPSLPEGIGSIPLSEVCELGTKVYVDDFEEFLLPLEERVYTRPPRIMVTPSDWETVCKGLLDKGVCSLLSEREVAQVNGRPIFNGMFAVSKGEFTPGGIEVMRLIMNLVPTNKLCRSLGGDISTLPSWAGMSPYLLEDNEVLLMSSEDIRCFFYLFSIPTAWWPYMCFGREVPSSLAPSSDSGPFYLCSRVLPMGYLNSVSIAQHVHRRVARLALHSPRLGVGPQNEIRKDLPFSSNKWLYRIYLDNFDSLQKVDLRMVELLEGKVSAEVLALRESYMVHGMPRHPKKAVEQCSLAEIQGAIVDGKAGRVKPKPQKVLKYAELAIQLLEKGEATQRQMQIVCGGFVYCCMFRRALLGGLNAVWTFITSFGDDPPVIRRRLPLNVQVELWRFICLAPLAQMNLRAPMKGAVTASDASEYGGGFCISAGLTPMGVHASSCQVRGDLPEVEDHVQVLTVGLFDGVGALRVAADCLSLPMAGHISSEVSLEGSRVIETHFPDSESVGDVQGIDDSLVQGWSLKYSNVGVVLVAGGPPCQGVSGLNSDRKGSLKDARSKLFVHVPRVFKLCRKHFRWAQVHYLMESVSSMDESDRVIMSKEIGSLPWRIDPSCISLCRRPRLYWVSWEFSQGMGVVVTPPATDAWTDFGTVELYAKIDPQDFLISGWKLNGEVLPTFTTSRPRDSPGNRPAGIHQCTPFELQKWKDDLHRFPPYVYREVNGVSNDQGDWRLPTIQEKEVIMGFPVDFTSPCVNKSQQRGDNYLDMRHTLVGNSWHVPTVTWILKELFFPLGMTRVFTLDDVVTTCTPGSSSSLATFLRRPPLRQRRKAFACNSEVELTKRLVNFISVKGEDLLLQASTENQACLGLCLHEAESRRQAFQKACTKAMPKKKTIEGKTQQQRIEQRKALGSLKSLTVMPKTRQRYEHAMSLFFQYLKVENLVLPKQRSKLDDILADYLEFCWERGEGRALAADTLAGLQDADPKLRGMLQSSWRLMKVWVQHEIPARAPPLPEAALQGLVGYALLQGDAMFALSLLLGYYGMLRTGEVLGLSRHQVEITSENGPAIISLGLTKSGRRQGAEESATITVHEVTRRLFQWKQSRVRQNQLDDPSSKLDDKWRPGFAFPVGPDGPGAVLESMEPMDPMAAE
eukprot:Skav211889  [mRNA]  locus=scaffold2402:77193:83007:- [translate_table: standard]